MLSILAQHLPLIPLCLKEGSVGTQEICRVNTYGEKVTE